jgi:hypothetical protein
MKGATKKVVMQRQRLVASLCVAVAGMAPLCHADSADNAEWKNWFDDPYFQVSNAIPACPEPRGPLLREADVKQEEHGRVERGTSCWMAGRCSKPNAYMYDADIGKALQQRFAQTQAFADTSLWVTVKRKFVWIEGCVANADQEKALQAIARDVPDVEQVLVNVMVGPSGKAPYEKKP